MLKRGAIALVLAGAVAGGIWWAARGTDRSPGPGPAEGPPAAPTAPPPAAAPGREEAWAFLVGLLDRLAAGEGVADALAPGVKVTLPGERLRQYRVEDDPAGLAQFRVQAVWEVPGASRLGWARAAVGRQGAGLVLAAWDPLPGGVAVAILAPQRLVVRAGGEEAAVLDTAQDLPAAVRPHGAPPGVHFGPGRDLVAAAVRPGGQQAAFLTRGTHGLVGLVGLGARAHQVVPLDLYYGGTGRELAWSWDGRYLAVIYETPQPAAHLAVYDLAQGERVGPALPGAPAGLRWTQEGILWFAVGGQPWRWDPADGARPAPRA